MLFLVRPENLSYYWPLAKGWLEPSLARDGCDLSLDYLADVLLHDRAQLWVNVDEAQVTATAITDLTTTPAGRLMTILVVGGKDVEDWIDYADQLAYWAESIGCMAAEGVGRRGWGAHLPEGWKEAGTIFRKELA